MVDAPAKAPEGAPISVLLETHRAFLRYPERKVGDRALADDNVPKR
jgi:hypothetical protein